MTRVEFNAKMKTTDQKFEDITEIMLREFDKVYNRFDAVDQRFDSMENRFNLRFNRLDEEMQIVKSNQVVMMGSLNNIMKHFGIKDAIVAKA